MSERAVIEKANVEFWITDYGRITLTITDSDGKFLVIDHPHVVKGRIPWPSIKYDESEAKKDQCCECGGWFDPDDLVSAERDELLWCPKCARENLIECAYCGSLRWPENLFEYDGGDMKRKNKYYGKKMCIGCMDDASDEDWERAHGDDDK